MPWATSGVTASTWSYTALNTLNQMAAPVSVPANCAVTKLRARVSSYDDTSVNTRLALWNSDYSVLAQTSTFTMGIDSGTPDNIEKTITAALISSARTVYVGVYRDPKKSHKYGHASTSGGIAKTNTATFPSIIGMSGYSSVNKMEAAVFYITAPDAPTSATVTRVSDTQHIIGWTNNASTDQPYTNIRIQRWDNVTGVWYDLKTISGSLQNYTDTTTRNDRRYQYRVRAENAAGNSSYATTGYIYTTPIAPTNVVAARSGLNIIVSWSNPSTIDTAVQIEHRVDSGSYSLLDTLAANSTGYTHTTPGAGVHQYRVRVAAGSTYSAYAVSNTVETMQPPLAPTNLSPNGTVFDATEDQTFTWQHNSADGTTQTAYALRYRTLGAPSWTTTGKVTSTASSRQIASATLSNGYKYEWQVRTYGEYVDPSPWSASATFLTFARPIATITYPASDYDEHTTSDITVDWLFSGSFQREYIVSLYDADDNLLHTYHGVAETTEYTIPHSLANNTTYKVGVLVRVFTGLWSVEVVRIFVTNYPAPEKPVVSASFDPTTATANIEIVNPEPGEGVPEALYNRLYRSVDGGAPVLIADNVPPNSAITDYIPGVANTNVYYAVAVSETDSITKSDDAELVTDIGGGRHWLNSGAAFSDGLALYMDAKVSVSYGRKSVQYHFAGREYPTAYENANAKSTGVSLSALLNYDDEAQAVKVLETNYGPLCYRDHTGRRLFVSLTGNPQITPAHYRQYQISLSMTRVDYNG